MGSSNNHTDNLVSPGVPLADRWVSKPGTVLQQEGLGCGCCCCCVSHPEERAFSTTPLQARGVWTPSRVTSASSLFISTIPLLAVNRPCGTWVTLAQGFAGLQPDEVWPPPKPLPQRTQHPQQPRPSGSSNPSDARICPLPRMGTGAGGTQPRGT